MLGGVHVRSGAMPGEPEPDPAHRPGPTEPPSAGPDPSVTPAGSALSWRVTPGATVLKWVGAGLFAAVALASTIAGADAVTIAIALLGALVLALQALRDVLAPVRLAADLHGLTVVSGFAGRRRIPWSVIERIRVDERTRFGVRSPLLEIDTGETLHLISARELGAPCDEVVQSLAALRTGG
jgi:hypothetical protein